MDLIEKILKDFGDRQVEIAVAATHKEPADLTEAETFAFCFLAGAQIETTLSTDPGKFGFRLKNPCGVRKIDGKFQVVERRDPPIHFND